VYSVWVSFEAMIIENTLKKGMHK